MNNSEFSEWGKKLERLAQAGVQKEIAEHKASNRSIFYERNGTTIMELPDGRCFEYRLQDGKIQILTLPAVERTGILGSQTQLR